jgi:hypothetical protein
MRYVVETVSRVRQGASGMEQLSDQSRQYLERGIAEVLRFFDVIWTWSSDQFIKLAQAPWQRWPLLKQILLLLVVAAVAYFLLKAAVQLWTGAINLLSAFATFVGTVIVALPTILIAAVIAVAGLWGLNQLQDVPSLRSLMNVQSQPGSASAP